MAITNYDTLVSAVIEHLEDDSAEFSNYVPKAINLAEDRIITDLDFQESRVTETITKTSIGNKVTVGTSTGSYLFPLYVYAETTVSSGNFVKLKQVDESFINAYQPVQIDNITSTDTGIPKYYSVREEFNPLLFSVAPAFNENQKFTFTYSQKPQKLSSSVSTNIIIQKCPDLLFQATLLEMAEFSKMWETYSVRESKYMQTLARYANIERMKRREVGKAPLNPEPVLQTKQNIN